MSSGDVAAARLGDWRKALEECRAGDHGVVHVQLGAGAFTVAVKRLRHDPRHPRGKP